MRTRLVETSLEDVLAEIETRPKPTWSELLRTRFPDDPDLVRQALIWLHAGDREDLPGATPSLGIGGERYELAELLDSGATASVWKAYDRKLGRHVAIKVFHRGTSSMIRQSLAEARASSEVISEHVVRVHDVHDADPPYIVLELVAEHEPGHAVLDGASAAACRPHDVAEAVKWIRDAARGVHDAHLHDVFHRDLKPHNVLITPISRRAKIADFGLAISATSTSEASSSPGLVLNGPSGPARIAGTPEYMAPEQARGLRISLDARAADDRRALVAVDVWGLGAIAYDLLSGKSPWQAREGASAWESAAGLAPPRLDRTAAGESIPRRLQKIVERALAYLPADRYPSAADVADELDAYLARRPTSFDRSARARFGLWVRRNPQLTATAGVAALCATMSLAAYISVVGLRDRSRELGDEIQQVERDKESLATRVLMDRSLRLVGGDLWNVLRTAEDRRTRAARLFGEVRAGRLTVTIDERFPLARGGDAHHALEGRGRIGKLLLIP